MEKLIEHKRDFWFEFVCFDDCKIQKLHHPLMLSWFHFAKIK